MTTLLPKFVSLLQRHSSGHQKRSTFQGTRIIYAAFILSLTSVSDTYGFMITQDAGSTARVVKRIGDKTFTVSLQPNSMEYLDAGATTARRMLLNTEFDGRDADGTANPTIDWTFNAGTALDGTATIAQYDALIQDAFFTEPLGGAILDLSFNGAEMPTNLRWIHFVETSHPVVAGLNPTVDPPNTSRPVGDDDLPFYFTEDETIFGFFWVDPLFSNPGDPFRIIQNPDADTDLVFLDRPRRFLSRAPLDWDGFLYLVEWDGVHGGTVTIHDGIHWGFTIAQAVVAEPSTGILLIFGMVMLLGSTHRRRIKQ